MSPFAVSPAVMAIPHLNLTILTSKLAGSVGFSYPAERTDRCSFLPFGMGLSTNQETYESHEQDSNLRPQICKLGVPPQ